MSRLTQIVSSEYGDTSLLLLVCDICDKREPFLLAGYNWIHLESAIPDSDLMMATPVRPIINRIDVCGLTCLMAYSNSATPNL